MQRSMVYLGESLEYEREIGRRLPGSLRALHAAAQRVAWGILMGERVGVDVESALRYLLRRHGDHFAAHVTAAIGRRAQNRAEEAERHLQNARELLPAGHPWARLIPTDAEWHAPPLVPQLEEDEPGRVYRVIDDSAKDGGLGTRGVGRFLRMRSGELVYVNPVSLPDDVVDRVRRLGDVTHIIAPAKYHSNHAPRAKELFPRARLWGVRAHESYPNVRHVKFDGFLDDASPLFPGELEHVTLRGVDVGDVWIVDRASRTLITTDALFLTTASAPGADAFRSPFGTFYAWAWGVFDRVGIPSYQPAMWSNITAYSGSIRRALALDFEHVGSCHGSWRGIEGDAPRKLEERIGWIHELGRPGGMLHLADFVRRHPGVFWTFVREQIAARRKRAPGQRAALA